MAKPKIICTIGPNSRSSDILQKLKTREVALFRINLSHTKVEDIEKEILNLKQNEVEVCIDTEGSQVRTGYLGKEYVELKENSIIKLYNHESECNDTQVYIRPTGILENLQEGDIVSVDFNSVLLKVTDVSYAELGKYVLCKVLIGGIVGNNKGVALLNKELNLPAYSEKDYKAFELAQKHGIKYFTLSFIDYPQDVIEFRERCPGCTAYAKIETRLGVENFEEILEVSDGVLLDRGDLGREVQVERIPLLQKIIIKKAALKKKDVFIATNILESMCTQIKPNRAEINDVINILLDGATGLVLTKETAVGSYPVETVNMALNLINHVYNANNEPEIKLLMKDSNFELRNLNYLKKGSNDMLIEPHGGKLVNRISKDKETVKKDKDMPSLTVTSDKLLELEQIGTGAYSPLEGFLNVDELESVLNNMRLKSGDIWTIPVVLRIGKKEADRLREGEDVLILGPDKLEYAILHLEQKYTFNMNEYCVKLYNTKNNRHPGVREALEFTEQVFLAGKITLLRRPNHGLEKYKLTPSQVRTIFEEKGWSKVVGFHTRNVVHRSHEYIQLNSLLKSGCDGLLIHPVIGKKKSGDFHSEIILNSYELIINKYYPQNRVVLSAFSSNSYYAGPKEAIFTAICRKNFGCSHFIVGRDHTGVFDFYDKYDSHKIFDNFPDLGIKPIRFSEVAYSTNKGYHLRDEFEENQKDDVCINISGSKLREMIKNGERPDSVMMRPEVFEMILNEIKSNNKVFVE